jgi:hypothetical protein
MKSPALLVSLVLAAATLIVLSLLVVIARRDGEDGRAPAAAQGQSSLVVARGAREGCERRPPPAVIRLPSIFASVPPVPETKDCRPPRG